MEKHQNSLILGSGHGPRSLPALRDPRRCCAAQSCWAWSESLENRDFSSTQGMLWGFAEHKHLQPPVPPRRSRKSRKNRDICPFPPSWASRAPLTVQPLPPCLSSSPSLQPPTCLKLTEFFLRITNYSFPLSFLFSPALKWEVISLGILPESIILFSPSALTSARSPFICSYLLKYQKCNYSKNATGVGDA